MVESDNHARLLPNRSPVAWGSQRIALGTLTFDSNTFHFICWTPKFSAFSSEGSVKIFLGSSLAMIVKKHFWNTHSNITRSYFCLVY